MFFHRKKKAKKQNKSAISGGPSNAVLNGHRKHMKQLSPGSQASIDQTNLGKLKHHVSIAAHVSKWLHLDPFHRIERQIVSAVLALTSLVVSLSICGVQDHLYHVRQSETLTNYGAHAKFSKTTDPTMTLHHLQMSSDRKTVFVPISFDNMSQLSENAKKYGVFISAAMGSINYHPAGKLALFGDTGRGVIIMHDIHGFSNEPINVFLLNYTNLDNSGAQQSEDDTVFDGNDSGIDEVRERYDALNFKINPGAKDEHLNPKLSAKTTASNMYNQLFAKSDEAYYKHSDRKARHKIKVNENVSQDEIYRLHHEGFDLKTSHVKVPAWLKPNWRPFDAIQSNGVPRNLENKKNAESVMSDGANSPILNQPDSQDQGHYPGSLKKKDGTTTASASNNSDSQGSGKSSTINGGSNMDPSSMWQDLKQAWDNILQEKHDIYTKNAAQLYKIRNTRDSQNQNISIGKRFKVLKHLV